jgi:hypothetical protein
MAAENGAAVGGEKKLTQVRHFLVQVEDDGSCVVFMEPGRSRHACLEDLVLCSTSLLEFYPGIPKVEALQQLRKYKNED